MNRRVKLAVFLSHPVQYYSPWFAELSKHVDLSVYYALKDTALDQAAAGFGVEFDWDIDLLSGYPFEFLNNVATNPQLAGFAGCDVPEVKQKLKHTKPDAVLTFGWHKKFYCQVLSAAYQLGIPAFVRVDSQLASPRSLLKRVAKYVPYRLVLPAVAHYLSPGERSDEYLQHYGVSASRIHRVPHMIDVQRFASGRSEEQCLRAQQQLQEDQIVLLFVGKLIEKKHPATLISALKLLPEAQRRRFVLWYVGSGPLEQELRDASQTAEVEVQFLGFKNQTELPAIYAEADCLVLPSDAGETWGLVVNEAIASGTAAIVSSEVGAGPALIRDDNTGWVFRFGDPASLSKILTRLDRKRLAAMIPGLETCARGFSYETGSALFLETIEGVLT